MSAFLENDYIEVDVDLGGGVLWQLANRGGCQMMSYCIETPDDRLIVIDGGMMYSPDGQFLYDCLMRRGGKVDMWIITHAHEDHFGALSWMLQNIESFALEIDALYFTCPPPEWVKSRNEGNSFEELTAFLASLSKHGIGTKPFQTATTLICGGVSIEVLADGVQYERFDNINDTSAVLRVKFPNRDVLFLGDLGVEGGKLLLREIPEEKVRCDIVQMAHHGQNGVDRDFYTVVQPKICLYTAPIWLWDNDSGAGKDSGPWNTLKTRQWMQELGVELECPIAYGDYCFR